MNNLADLKAALKAAGIKQTDVATACGVTRQMVVHVLAGRTQSESNVLATIRRLLKRRGVKVAS